MARIGTTGGDGSDDGVDLEPGGFLDAVEDAQSDSGGSSGGGGGGGGGGGSSDPTGLISPDDTPESGSSGGSSGGGSSDPTGLISPDDTPESGTSGGGGGPPDMKPTDVNTTDPLDGSGRGGPPDMKPSDSFEYDLNDDPDPIDPGTRMDGTPGGYTNPNPPVEVGPSAGTTDTPDPVNAGPAGGTTGDASADDPTERFRATQGAPTTGGSNVSTRYVGANPGLNVPDVNADGSETTNETARDAGETVGRFVSWVNESPVVSAVATAASAVAVFRLLGGD